MKPTTLVLALAPFALALSPAAAGESPQEAVLRELREELRQLSARVGEQEEEIRRLREAVGAEELEAARGRGAAPSAPLAPLLPLLAAGPAQAEAPVTVGQAQAEQQERERSTGEEVAVLREHAPLFERQFNLDVGQSLSYYDRRQLTLSGFLALDAIFLGTINLDQTKSSLWTTDVTARYGLSERWSVDAQVPWVHRRSRFISGGAGGGAGTLSEVDTSSSGIGDVSAAVFYHLMRESGTRPDLVASLRVRAPTGESPFGIKLIQGDEDNTNLNVPASLPTGTGLWSATLGVSALRTYDPVVLFGSLSYTHYRRRFFDDISPVLENQQPASVDLGNPVQLGVGMALALNDRASMSLAFNVSAAASTHTRAEGADDWVRVPGSASNTATFNVGGGYLVGGKTSVNVALGVGLTQDAPDYVLSVRGGRAF